MTVAAALLNTPTDQGSWDIWAFTLGQNISDIQQALRTQRGVNLPNYQLYPIPWPALTEWLERVGLAMGDITANTGIPNADVENVDLADLHELQRWTNSIFSEIRNARATLKI